MSEHYMTFMKTKKKLLTKSLTLKVILMLIPTLLISCGSGSVWQTPNDLSNFRSPKRFQVKAGTKVEFSGKQYVLPENLHVITLEEHKAAIARSLIN